MTPQLRHVRERLAAVRAQVRPVTHVVRHVHLQLTRAVPDLATDGAAERPVVGMMHLNVLPEFDDRRELLPVLAALEAALAAVRAQVTFQAASPHILQTTLRTLVRTLTCSTITTNTEVTHKLNII